MSDDLYDRILLEINKTGFPLELRTAEVLKSRGYSVAHSLFYIDEDEGKPREVDLRALKMHEIKLDNRTFIVRHWLLVECKKTADKHWVFFGSEKGVYDPDHYLVPNTPDLGRFIHYTDYAKIKEVHPFNNYPVRCRSYFEIGKNNQSNEMIYKALTTATKASIYTMKKHGDATYDISFYYPIVVYDGRLFQAVIENDDTKLDEVDSVLVSFLYEPTSYKSVEFAIPVLKLKELDKFLIGLNNTLDVTGQIIEKDIDRILKLMFSEQIPAEAYKC